MVAVLGLGVLADEVGLLPPRFYRLDNKVIWDENFSLLNPVVLSA